MKKLRFGIAGTGGIARDYHLPLMVKNPRAEVVAACNWRLPSLNSLAQQFRIPKTYTDFDQMARDPEVDAVLVALPNNLHASVTVKMLQQGKHVLCEKPMARTVGEAQAMVDAADAAHRKLVIAHPWRCDQDFRWLREVVDSGKLGRVFKVRCHAVVTGSDPPMDSWRVDPEAAGGGALTDLGVHVIDTVSFLFNDSQRPAKVFARTGNYFTKARVEDTATVLIEFDNGMLAVIDAGWHHKFQNSPHGALEVFGTEGYARTFPTELHCRIAGGWSCCRPTLHPERPHIDLSMFAAQIDAFIDCVLSDKKPACDGKQGLRNVAVLEAAYRSARTGEPVSLNDAASNDVAENLKASS